MELLEDQFEKAVEFVSISQDKAKYVIAAHTEVRALLESDEQLKKWGIDTILIGSYARDTSRYPAKDADVFLRFMNLTVKDDPRVVYAAVAAVLIKKYGAVESGGRVTSQPRSLKIDFPSPTSQADLSFSVDAVPAVRWGEDWGIPNRRPELWENADARWIKTNPIEFTAKTDRLSVDPKSPVVGGRNAYKPIVRLLRQTRHVHLGGARPGGLYVEVLAYYSWISGEVAGDSWAVLFEATLKGVAARMRDAALSGVNDPVLGTKMLPSLTPDQWNAAAERFEALATTAGQALESPRCMAAKLWRQILGKNERGEVFQLPPGCSADGVPVGSVTAVTSVGSTESRGFATHLLLVR